MAVYINTPDGFKETTYENVVPELNRDANDRSLYSEYEWAIRCAARQFKEIETAKFLNDDEEKLHELELKTEGFCLAVSQLFEVNIEKVKKEAHQQSFFLKLRKA